MRTLVRILLLSLIPTVLMALALVGIFSLAGYWGELPLDFMGVAVGLTWVVSLLTFAFEPDLS